MKKLAILMFAATLSVLVLAVAASADPPVGGPPGQGECEHGNSGQTCVPDPQPTHGQDCEEHGNEGGVNEDHCLSTSTTVSPTTTTQPPSSTTTTTPVTTASEVPPSTTTTSTATTVPTPTETTTTTPVVVTTPVGTTGSQSVTKPVKQPKLTSGSEKLAFTGVEDVVPLAAGALVLVSLGSGLMWAGSRRRAK